MHNIPGNWYIADFGNSRIRKVSASSSEISTVVGTSNSGYNGDNQESKSASLNGSVGIVLDSNDNLYISDMYNHRIRQVSTNNKDGSMIITTVAGTGNAGYSGDNGQATAAMIKLPNAITVDSSNNVYFGDINSYHVIRKITVATGVITTFAGTGIGGYNGDNIQATAATLYNVDGIEFDGYGNMYICDTLNNRIRQIDVTGLITTVIGNGSASSTGDGYAAALATVNEPCYGRMDTDGNYYISECQGNRIRKVVAFVQYPSYELQPFSVTLLLSLFFSLIVAFSCAFYACSKDSSQEPQQESVYLNLLLPLFSGPTTTVASNYAQVDGFGSSRPDFCVERILPVVYLLLAAGDFVTDAYFASQVYDRMLVLSDRVNTMLVPSADDAAEYNANYSFLCTCVTFLVLPVVVNQMLTVLSIGRIPIQCGATLVNYYNYVLRRDEDADPFFRFYFSMNIPINYDYLVSRWQEFVESFYKVYQDDYMKNAQWIVDATSSKLLSLSLGDLIPADLTASEEPSLKNRIFYSVQCWYYWDCSDDRFTVMMGSETSVMLCQLIQASLIFLYPVHYLLACVVFVFAYVVVVVTGILKLLAQAAYISALIAIGMLVSAINALLLILPNDLY